MKQVVISLFSLLILSSCHPMSEKEHKEYIENCNKIYEEDTKLRTDIVILTGTANAFGPKNNRSQFYIIKCRELLTKAEQAAWSDDRKRYYEQARIIYQAAEEANN